MSHIRRPMIATALTVALFLAIGPAASAATDPLWAEQWGPQQVDAPEAWPTSTGDGAVVAIVDSGVDLDHEDLAANAVAGNTFLDCGDSGCGNGDWESGGEPGHPHGTHVAGIAAAVTDNGVGIKGVAPDATILAVRVLDENGSGSFEDIARGVRWSTDNGADVINLSLGALPGVQVLEMTGLVSDVRDAIAYATSRGVVVVVAAGNESFPLCASPAFNDGAVCVTATDQREAKAFYANQAIKPDLLAVSAPGGSGLPLCGEDIVSTVPAGEGGACSYPDTYDEFAGTSMAAPHVAGVAAMLTATGCAGDAAVSAITSTARNPVTGQRGAWDPAYGYGIVDADNALAACPVTVTQDADAEPRETPRSGPPDERDRPDRARERPE
ncbi:MAG: S8 family serine peptidase [Actinobacteria bacterium]|nr:S8 family serine peptidase [Actinomycetota bacterium]